MRFIISIVFFLSLCSFALGQGPSKTLSGGKEFKTSSGEVVNISWFSETKRNGILIQNSYPRGGPYRGETKKNFNYTHLIFFTRLVNEGAAPLKITLNFSADSIPIPGSPDTFVKLFLPPDTMTIDKNSMYGYGVKDLKSFDEATRFQKKLNPGEDCLFNVVAIFYQTNASAQDQHRGGNRAEFVLKGQDLFYRMPPQIDYLLCGHIKR